MIHKKKRKPSNFRLIFVIGPLWRKFKARCAERDINLPVGAAEAITDWLAKEK